MSVHCFNHGYFVPVIIDYDSILFYFGFLKHNFFLLKDSSDMVISINMNTRPGMHFVVRWLYHDKLVLCPTSQIAREVFGKIGLTCVTLDGFVVN